MASLGTNICFWEPIACGEGIEDTSVYLCTRLRKSRTGTYCVVTLKALGVFVVVALESVASPPTLNYRMTPSSQLLR